MNMPVAVKAHKLDCHDFYIVTALEKPRLKPAFGIVKVPIFDNAEIEIQRRRMAGWQLGLSHREYVGSATLDLHFHYKQGTGAYHSRPAPEEQFAKALPDRLF